MLRSRILRPGIVTNELLAGLGPEATLLFERLWMIADREGRLEDRPARIRAECFPYWPAFPVEKLLEKLCKSGFITRYKPTRNENAPTISIKNFRKHQPIHPHEAKSALLAPPRNRTIKRTSAPRVRRTMSADVITCPDMSGNVALPLPIPIAVENSSNSGGLGGLGGFSTETAKNPPPPKKPCERKPPARAAAAVASGAHKPEEVALMRRSLAELAHEIRMPPPDDGIVRRVLDAARGASSAEIEAALAALYKRDKFREMRSWGLIPLIVADCFGRDPPVKARA